jgi:hypothetical protein
MSLDITISTATFIVRAADVLGSIFSRPLKGEKIEVPALRDETRRVAVDGIFGNNVSIPRGPKVRLSPKRVSVREEEDATSDEMPSGGIGAWAPATNAHSKRTEQLAVSKHFKLVFLTVTSITLVCGIAYVVMAFSFKDFTQPQTSAFESVGFAWKVGVGAIFGLLGGKAT